MITDSATLIMGILFTIAIFAPVVFFVYLGKKRLLKTIKILSRIQFKGNFKLTEKDVWNDHGLAIDPLKKAMVWVDTSTANYKWRIIDLTKVWNSQVVDTPNMIQLIITYRDDQNHPFEVITLFDAKIDDPFEKGFHGVLARKWNARIHQLIHKSTSPTITPRRAA